ncbi:MAG: TetR family transcriptional regulator [Alphaproteobacteria bacterium]|nr:TetR family transcriptional regulator [Alphaproteobacteria bacterium]
MPRPSMKSERREQVLTAYVVAVSKYGLSGATLQTIAAEAGLKRPLVRHHLGNKEAMFEQLVAHVLSEFSEQTRQLKDALPATGRVEALIDILFDEASETVPELVLVFAELTLMSACNRGLAERLSACITEFEDMVTAEIRRENRSAAAPKSRAVSHGIMAIYFNRVSLAPLSLDASSARGAVNILIQSLNEEPG